MYNQVYIARPTFIDLNPNEQGVELHYHPFIVSLNKFGGTSNTSNDP